MKFPTALRKPEDETGADDNGGDEAVTVTASRSKRKQVSKRLLIGADGQETKDEAAATGARYILLDPRGNHEFNYTFGENLKADAMLAMFGFHTKVGNVANTVLNDKDEPGEPGDAAEAVAAWLEQLRGGVWAVEREGGVGARIDLDALAAAIVHVFAAKGQTRDLMDVRQKLEDDKGLRTKMRNVPEIADEYRKRAGKPAKTVDEVLDLI